MMASERRNVVTAFCRAATGPVIGQMMIRRKTHSDSPLGRDARASYDKQWMRKTGAGRRPGEPLTAS
jgi:hypothetical protein